MYVGLLRILDYGDGKYMHLKGNEKLVPLYSSMHKNETERSGKAIDIFRASLSIDILLIILNYSGLKSHLFIAYA